MKKKTGIILFTHGSRLKKANWAMLALARKLRRRLDTDCIIPCFMELGQPDIPAAVRKLVARGCNHIFGYALFLVPGRHLREDVPRIIRKTLKDHPGVTFELSEPMLEDPALIEMVEQQLARVLPRKKVLA